MHCFISIYIGYFKITSIQKYFSENNMCRTTVSKIIQWCIIGIFYTSIRVNNYGILIVMRFFAIYFFINIYLNEFVIIALFYPQIFIEIFFYKNTKHKKYIL